MFMHVALRHHPMSEISPNMLGMFIAWILLTWNLLTTSWAKQ